MTMPYMWADTQMIQLYLSAGSGLEISASGVPETSAQVYENEAVYEISDILSAAWEGLDALTTGTCPVRLKQMAAKLTAARIATLNVGTALAKLPLWVDAFESQIHSQCIRMALNHKTIDLGQNLTVREDVDPGDLLILTKIRQQAVTENV